MPTNLKYIPDTLRATSEFVKTMQTVSPRAIQKTLLLFGGMSGILVVGGTIYTVVGVEYSSRKRILEMDTENRNRRSEMDTGSRNRLLEIETSSRNRLLEMETDSQNRVLEMNIAHANRTAEENLRFENERKLQKRWFW